MVTLIGFAIVTVCVILGYTMHHGNLLVLWQPTELLIIFGAAIGGMIAACSSHLLKSILHWIIEILKPPAVTKGLYLEVVKLLYELFKTAAGNPLAIEAHVEKPRESSLFTKYPLILKNHVLTNFIANTLSLQISANLEPHDLEDLLDNDIHTLHEEEELVPKTISRVADALPGLGIVAAVLGIVITMGKLAQGKEVIGQSVAAALVGTFLGVLLSYGFFQPLAAKIETMIAERGKVLQVVKSALVAYAKGTNAKVCVEFARRTIPEEYRIEYAEMDEITASVGKGGDAGGKKAA